jgi:hypothetical protein
VDISFKDDVTAVLLLGVSIMGGCFSIYNSYKKFKFQVTILNRFEMAKLQPAHFSKGTVTGDY